MRKTSVGFGCCRKVPITVGALQNDLCRNRACAG
jgi:hypothetical protein